MNAHLDPKFDGESTIDEVGFEVQMDVKLEDLMGND